MATTSVRSVIPHLHRALGVDFVGSADGALVERFVAERNGDALAALHGQY